MDLATKYQKTSGKTGRIANRKSNALIQLVISAKKKSRIKPRAGKIVKDELA
jgi:hypothetical protein